MKYSVIWKKRTSFIQFPLMSFKPSPNIWRGPYYGHMIK